MQAGLTVFHRLCYLPATQSVSWIFKEAPLHRRELMSAFVSRFSRAAPRTERRPISERSPLDLLVEGATENHKSLVDIMSSWFQTQEKDQEELWHQLLSHAEIYSLVRSLCPNYRSK
jgi:hypothetical protein